jgi:Mu-like prophage protein gp36
MAYIDQTTIEKYIATDELIRLTDDENAGVINSERLNEAINIASNEFDNYLRDIYDLSSFPINLPEQAVQLIVDLTIYHLYKRRFRLDMPESIDNIYNNALLTLSKIAKGELQVDLPKKISAGFIKINKTEDDRIFNKDILDTL